MMLIFLQQSVYGEFSVRFVVIHAKSVCILGSGEQSNVLLKCVSKEEKKTNSLIYEFIAVEP